MTAAIILGGTYVWRDGSFESLCPRLLLPVANVPLVRYLLVWLENAGVRKVVFCVNQAESLLESYLGDGQPGDFDLHYFVDRVPRGPAGCSRDASAIVPAEQYVVAEGAIIPGADLLGLLDFHAHAGAAATVVVDRLARSNGRAGQRSSPAGIYIFAPDALAQVPSTSYQDIKEMLIPRLSRKAQPVVAYPAERPSPRLSGLDGYLAAQGWTLARLRAQRKAPANYEWHNGACIHGDARVAASARLLGPVMIGPGARVEDDVIIVGPSVIGGDSLIGSRSVLECSVTWQNCAVGPNARLDRCLVTAGATINPETDSHSSVLSADPAP